MKFLADHTCRSALLLVAILGTANAVAADAPQVVELIPANGAIDVDPDIKELRITFARNMSTRGWSLCGGGPSFPEMQGHPRWKSKRTLIVRIKLKPDHDYALMLNCPAAHNFQSADGTALVPVPWSFSTASRAPKLSKPKQKKLNARSLKQLMKLLRKNYSYYDHRDIDWSALAKKHRRKILAASSTRSWVKRVAKMLSPARDLHMWLTYRDHTTATYRRKVRANFDLQGIKTVLPGLTQRNSVLYSVRTDDNIGYVLITTLAPEQKKNLRKVQDVFRTYQDCKAMVIDLRPNGGGDEMLARDIAAWFIEGERVYAKHVYRKPGSDNNFGQIVSRTIIGNKPPNRFDKPVAVLTGPAIMSSAEALLLMMKQGSRVTLIGATSYGSSGNPKPHKLKNDVTAFIPSWKAMRPDGTCFEGEGIRPDIEVKASPGKFRTGDPVLLRALKLLRKNDN